MLPHYAIHATIGSEESSGIAITTDNLFNDLFEHTIDAIICYPAIVHCKYCECGLAARILLRRLN